MKATSWDRKSPRAITFVDRHETPSLDEIKRFRRTGLWRNKSSLSVYIPYPALLPRAHTEQIFLFFSLSSQSSSGSRHINNETEIAQPQHYRDGYLDRAAISTTCDLTRHNLKLTEDRFDLTARSQVLVYLSTMCLLRTDELSFKECFDKQIPNYAILSHWWGDDEVSYQELHKLIKAAANSKHKASLFAGARYAKIRDARIRASMRMY
jgi:hypothetical protein